MADAGTCGMELASLTSEIVWTDRGELRVEGGWGGGECGYGMGGGCIKVCVEG